MGRAHGINPVADLYGFVLVVGFLAMVVYFFITMVNSSIANPTDSRARYQSLLRL